MCRQYRRWINQAVLYSLLGLSSSRMSSIALALDGLWIAAVKPVPTDISRRPEDSGRLRGSQWLHDVLDILHEEAGLLSTIRRSCGLPILLFLLTARERRLWVEPIWQGKSRRS